MPTSVNGVPASATSEKLRLVRVGFERDNLLAVFNNGTTVSVSLKRYPRLANATPAQRHKWRLIGKGLGVHWDQIDEDLSVENLLFAKAKD